MMMDGYGGHGMGTWGWIGMFLMLVFWFGLIALIVAAVMGWGRRQPPTPPVTVRADRALAILRERFARGELSAEEFEQARRVLTDTDS